MPLKRCFSPRIINCLGLDHIFIFLSLFSLLMVLWKCEYTTWHLYFSIGRNYFKPEDIIDEMDLKNFYHIVEMNKSAIAWKPVVFHIVPSAATRVEVGRTTFWGNATNELEIIALDIQNIGNDIYKVQFIPSFGGLYKVAIILTYVNGEQFKFYARHVKSRMVHVIGSPVFVFVQDRPPPENIARYCTQSESGTAQGRWVKCGSLRDIERCGHWQLTPRFDFDDHHKFFWLPYACQLHFYTNLEMKTCFAKNGWEKIIFTGDSHSRFRTYHWATRLYGACPYCGKNHVKMSFDHVPKMEWVFDARGTRWPATFPKFIQRPNEIYINAKTRRSMFSDSLPNSALDGQLILMNFGHWILREMTFRKFMNKKLAAFLEAVKLMNFTKGILDRESFDSKMGEQKRFLWVNTLSLKWREDVQVSNWTMTPSPSTISYLNSKVDQAMRDAGIQIVDAFQVSNPRLSATHDATHYAKLFPDDVCGGAVENAVSNVILNALCNDRKGFL